MYGSTAKARGLRRIANPHRERAQPALQPFGVLAALILAACTAVHPPGLSSPSAAPDRIILTWSDDPATSQAVSWRTAPGHGEPVGEIAVATDGPQFGESTQRQRAASTRLDSDLGPAAYHSLTFAGLEPATKYVYRVGDGEYWSEWSHFTTAHRTAEPFSFVYFGDAQNDIKSRWSRVVREAFKDAPRAAFLLHAGDLVNRANSDAEWGEWFYSAGWILRTMPSIATPGNHEYEGGQLSKHWAACFEFPRNGPPGFEDTVYYIDYQGARIVSLDSLRDIDTQAAWLDGVLRENDNRWTIVTMHFPIFSAAKDRDHPNLRATLQPLFDRHRVDLVLQGHDHAYTRTRLMHHRENHGPENLPTGATVQSGAAGTVYVVSVSGPKMYELYERPFMRSAAQGKQLYQILTIDGAELSYSAYSADGRLFDRFLLRKRAGAPNALIEVEV